MSSQHAHQARHKPQQSIVCTHRKHTQPPQEARAQQQQLQVGPLQHAHQQSHHILAHLQQWHQRGSVSSDVACVLGRGDAAVDSECT